MNNITKRCPIHHFGYTGVECPFCLQERIRKFSVKKTTEKVNEEEIFNNKLSELLEKYSQK